MFSQCSIYVGQQLTGSQKVAMRFQMTSLGKVYWYCDWRLSKMSNIRTFILLKVLTISPKLQVCWYTWYCHQHRVTKVCLCRLSFCIGNSNWDCDGPWWSQIYWSCKNSKQQSCDEKWEKLTFKRKKEHETFYFIIQLK